ncbi:L-serine ammonia-lyase, iron-sulfur-dependent, subunit alpha [Caproiciproducens sp. CPB-2]|uniref:L-serine ammonia-lyase, iron-sulfur-dependent, subunit alpha n=1 Tax=unclassified Caproiciproducens TaxID=2643836 RepID=UPI0023DA9D8F|nr:L-serine ammonia-lyase, iron-sulfur-dependent, subunit alpha [Caproiciproducens sp. CPB-2]MDF1494648.1 L-serine ammonia-lyase, iron-sulfur-dependent, subunit alpha [Caproiciproducens sp. CPB-2]
MGIYYSVEDLVGAAARENKKISEIVLEDQARELEKPEPELYRTMLESFRVMQQSVEDGIDPDMRSVSGLSGGGAYKMKQAVDKGRTLCGKVFGTALVRALAVSESNACMGKIVAAPTAGSCGIIPAALLTVMEDRELPERDVVMALFTASAFGMVIANNASISGAQGGCQAECGAASAMAAAALTELAGGTPQMAGHACAIAMKNILGLVCDPVAGLVEIPCIKRNAMGVANAFVGAELALAGIQSAIPADEVIVAMKRIGDAMPRSLKETSEGGLAATPTGKRLKKEIFGDS